MMEGMEAGQASRSAMGSGLLRAARVREDHLDRGRHRPALTGARAMLRAMRAQRFSARVAHGPRGHALIAVPFDPDQAWGAKADHPVGGTVNGRRVRGRITRDGSGWVFAYLRWIDATTRRPDLRAARIAEVVDLLAAGIKQRPRS
jgi:Domain of unknown function (DUF1905)